jgi:hypothetical protein
MDTKEKLGNTLRDLRIPMFPLQTELDMDLVCNEMEVIVEDGNVEKYEEVLAILQKGIRELDGR